MTLPDTPERLASRERNRRYYERHRERIRAKRRAWIADNRERDRAAKKRWRNENQAQKSESTRRYREENPEKRDAHAAVARAVRSGDMKRQPCEVCGVPLTHAHHDDYSQPLDVRWLCPLHHREVHDAPRT